MKKNQMILLGGIAATFALWLLMRNRNVAEEIVQNIPQADVSFYSPYYSTVPGFPDSYGLFNGQDRPFNSTVNVTVSNPSLSSLDNKYVPLFGFVGAAGFSHG